jgi:L-histidine Nalpha-methyltransferase
MPTTRYDAGARLRVERLEARAEAGGFAEDVRRGLTAAPKRLFPKYFYDELGSQLFEAICLLPEYYLTRAEAEIFADHSAEIVSAAAQARRVTLCELGSGSASKTRRLIEALLARQDELLYVPVDISTAALEASAEALLEAFPRLSITAYAGDYDAALPRLPENFDEGARALVLFLGSNVGNFDRGEARDFLRTLRRALRPGDALLLGADLKKDARTLEDAYDDPVGVTAAFNLNLLARINRELDADFRVRDFRHVAAYNEAEGRVEMHLESLRRQRVEIRALGLSVLFDEGERVHTENSYKYDPDGLAALASAAGFRLARTWLDGRGRFSSNLFIAEEEVASRQ